MNAPEHNSTADELLRHAQWIRSLARALVSDDAAAEDVAQETMVAALTHPPAQAKLRPWLRQVVRNFARLHHRSRGRRREHESGARGPSGLPGPEEFSERLEAEQELTRELARLDEPFRSTLMHRYYDDLAPAEIASRLGVPAGTVRWRLKRGLEILRSRLDDAHDGNRGAWSLALLPLARIENAAAMGAAAASVAIPGLVLMNAIKVACAAAAVCLLTVGLAVTGVLPETLVPWSRADAPLAVSFKPLAEPEAVELQPVLLEPQQREERVAAAPAPAASATPEAEPLAESLGPVVFEAIILGDGVPLAGAEFVVRSFDGERVEPAISARDGSVSVSVVGPGNDLSTTVQVQAPGYASVELQANGVRGSTTHLGHIDLAPGGVISGTVLDERGRGLANCRVHLARAGAGKRELQQLRFQSGHTAVPNTHTDASGRFRLAGVPTGLVRLWGHADDYASSYTAPIEVRAGQESHGVEFELELLSPSNLVRGIVLAPDGTPVPQAELQYRNSSKRTGTTHSGSRDADAEGRFEFLMNEDATLDLTASDPEGRWGRATVAGVRTGNLDLELRLREEVMLALEVVGVDGDPVTHYALEVLGEGGEHRLARETSRDREAGRCEFSRPTTAFLVRITAPGFDLLELGPLDPDLLDHAPLTAVLSPLPGLRGQVLRDGQPAAGVSVALHEQVQAPHSRRRNGFRMRMVGSAADRVRTDDEGHFLLTPRGRGGYFVRADPEEGVTAEFGPFEVGSDLSGPEVELHLAEGGAIEGRVILADDADPVGAIVGITRGDGRARTQRVGSDGLYRFDDLMAGPWRLELRDTELLSGTYSTTISDNGGESPFPEWSCTVFDGQTTFHDVREVPLEHWPFRGRLTVNGEAPGEWTAALVPSGSMDIDSGGPTASLTADGEFELLATTPGRQRLILRGILGERAEQYIVDEVIVENGSWNHDLEVGVLTVEGLGEWEGGIPQVVHYWKGRGELFCVTMVVPDDDGRVRIERAPAGASRLTKPSRPFVPENWEVIRELELEVGAEQTISLP